MTPTVLFDLYGTLVEPDWAELSVGRDRRAQEAGLPVDAARRGFDATHAERMRGAFGGLEGDILAVVRHASAAGATVRPEALQQWAARERASWCASVRAYDDAALVLRRLHAAGVRTAIVTNASAEAASVIPHLGLDALVERTFVSCEVGILKPDLLEHALRELRVDAADAVLVDDEPGQLEAARQLGLRTVLVRRPAAGAATAPADERWPSVSDLGAIEQLVLGPEPAPRR